MAKNKKPTAESPEIIIPTTPIVDPAVVEKISQMRSKVHESFGKVVLAMMRTARYKSLPISDLSHIALNAISNDRVGIAQATTPNTDDGGFAGILIWASVSIDVSTQIEEQIKAGTFPIQLKAEDWNSGPINWLLDVMAPTKTVATSIMAQFKQGLQEQDLRLHPLVAQLIDLDALKQMGIIAEAQEAAA
jgi:cytolysin-activating lysine-acyltransferase